MSISTSHSTRLSLPPETQTRTRSPVERSRNFRIPSFTWRQKNTKKQSGQKAEWWLGRSTAASARRQRLHFIGGSAPGDDGDDVDRLPVLHAVVLGEQFFPLRDDHGGGSHARL